MVNLATLLKVQEIDEEIRALEAVTRAIPVEIDGLRGELEAHAKTCQQNRNRLKELKVKEREKEGKVQDLDVQIGRLKQQLLEAKNNVVYQVLLKEIEKIKQEVDQVEDEGLEMIGSIDSLSAQVKDEEAAYEAHEREFKAEEASLLKRKGEAEARLKQLRDKRAQEIPLVPEDLRKRYQRIRDNKEGLAVVPLKDNVCSGCYNTIPIQKVNEIKHESGLKSCHQCGRILYYIAEGHED